MNKHTSADDAVVDADAVVLATQQGQALAALNCGFEGARGLMYVADAKRVLELSAAIVKGTKGPIVAEVQSRKGANGHSNDKACLTCSGARALHG